MFSFLYAEMALLAKQLCGTVQRRMEGFRLRIRDWDFNHRVIVVRDGEGGKDRVLTLPQSLAPALKAKLLQARAVRDADARAQRGGVKRPHALEKKYPKAAIPGAGSGWSHRPHFKVAVGGTARLLGALLEPH